MKIEINLNQDDYDRLQKLLDAEKVDVDDLFLNMLNVKCRHHLIGSQYSKKIERFINEFFIIGDGHKVPIKDFKALLFGHIKEKIGQKTLAIHMRKFGFPVCRPYFDGIQKRAFSGLKLKYNFNCTPPKEELEIDF